MSPLNFLSTRFYKTWPRISLSAIGYKGTVDLADSVVTLTTHQGGKTLGLSASSAISIQDQTRSSVRMHLVRAYCQDSYQVQFFGHIYIYIYIYKLVSSTLCKFIYCIRFSAIWRRKVEALSGEVHLIGDTMANLTVF